MHAVYPGTVFSMVGVRPGAVRHPHTRRRFPVQRRAVQCPAFLADVVFDVRAVLHLFCAVHIGLRCTSGRQHPGAGGLLCIFPAGNRAPVHRAVLPPATSAGSLCSRDRCCCPRAGVVVCRAIPASAVRGVFSPGPLPNHRQLYHCRRLSNQPAVSLCHKSSDVFQRPAAVLADADQLRRHRRIPDLLVRYAVSSDGIYHLRCNGLVVFQKFCKYLYIGRTQTERPCITFRK